MLSQSELWSESRKVDDLERWFDSVESQIKDMAKSLSQTREKCNATLEEVVDDCKDSFKKLEKDFENQLDTIESEICEAYKTEEEKLYNNACEFINKKYQEKLSELDNFIKRFEEFK